ncbi:MAG TPA: molybdenum cofactor biosynthesis protein E, partial [Halomonas sp.]|nr:molybdenum cofactor biosynthesis protein E [Halomonas sp.]
MAYGYESALRQRTDIGAIVTFTGLVRDFNETPDVTGLTLEHYPGMTERTLTQIAEQAWQRWALQA